MTINTAAVRALRLNYLAKRAQGQDLYQPASVPDSVIVCLPRELSEFSESTAGHHGYASGCAPIGIKRFVPGGDRERYLDRIFESDETLEAFIRTGDGSGPVSGREKYQRETVRRLTAGNRTVTVNSDPLDLPIRTYNLRALYGEEFAVRLRTAYAKTAPHDYAVLLRREFEARYDLSAVDTVAE